MTEVVRNNFEQIRLDRQAQEGKKITQKDMAKFLKIAKGQYCEMEAQKKQPSTKTLLRVSRILNLPMEKIVELKEE